MGGVARLTIRSATPDPRNQVLTASAAALGLDSVERIEVADIVFVEGRLSPSQRATLEGLLVDPLLQVATWDPPAVGTIETALLPGVTDPTGEAVMRAAALLDLPITAAASGRQYSVSGRLDDLDYDRLTRRLLANPVIERCARPAIAAAFVDRHATAARGGATTVELTTLDDEALGALNRERGLSLDLAELRAVAAHYRTLGREPTDVELEMIAQTWSEHCAHKTFRARITMADGQELPPLLTQLRRTTTAIAAPFVRRAFDGNAGIVSFVPGVSLAVKAETHNHPSAVEPFGGANTGVGGVIRDVMGTAHHPIAVTDVLCFGPVDTDPDTLPEGVLHPRLIEQGVVAGIADYGNKIGLPTVAGAVLYDAGYTANPLVYAGCIGIAGDAPALDGPHPGDLVVVLGGRTGRDGLRGATFSSATMDATTGDVAGASVQIGDPITERLLIDALADLRGRYSAITDCGAGGLSSAVGEMGEHTGADVDVALAPLKYPGLEPWEIWLSEAQERMVIAVAPSQWTAVQRIAARHGVEATALGAFTGDGVLRVRNGEHTVAEIDAEFLHDGRPQRSMAAVAPAPDRGPSAAVDVDDPPATLLTLLAHPNIASKAATIRRYDHEILGATAVRPLVGAEHDGHADGVVLAHPSDRHGFAIGIGVNPWYGELDPERMAHAAVDEAIRNVVAVGADPERVVLLDNFSWGDPRRAETLGQLVAAVRGCCDAAAAHGAPFVSGKDSLNNEYLGTDGRRHAVPPTLVITALAHVPDADVTVTPDLKQSSSILVLIGPAGGELGGSHFAKVHAGVLGAVPAPDPNAPARYRALHRALGTGRIRACHDVSEGGVAVAVAEMCIAGRLGADLYGWPAGPLALFGEANGRFVVEIDRADLDWLAAAIDEPVVQLGTVTADGRLRLPRGGTLTMDQLRKAFG